MKKKLLILYPYKFTNFEYYKFEVDKYKKLKFKTLVCDLSKILLSSSFNNEWKSKKYKHAITFNSFLEFYNYLKKNKNNSLILNFIQNHYSFKSTVIHLIIRILKIKQIHVFDEVLKQNPIKEIKKKNPLVWFFYKLKEHKFNFIVYFFYLNFYISKFFIKIIIKNDISFSNLKSSDKNMKIINFFDYSNSLEEKKINKDYKNYCLYLDNGGPYFKGDTELKGNKIPNYNVKKTYNDINEFFKKIELDFNCKIIIIPHPKYKSSKKHFSLNPYFSEFTVDNRPNILKALVKKAKFLLAKGSLANSYAVIYNKPIINFYSSAHEYEVEEISTIFEHAKLTGNAAFNIKKYSKKLFAKKIRISKSAYNKYLFSFLVNKSIRYLPNYKLISNYIIKYKI